VLLEASGSVEVLPEKVDASWSAEMLLEASWSVEVLLEAVDTSWSAEMLLDASWSAGCQRWTCVRIADTNLKLRAHAGAAGHGHATFTPSQRATCAANASPARCSVWQRLHRRRPQRDGCRDVMWSSSAARAPAAYAQCAHA